MTDKVTFQFQLSLPFRQAISRKAYEKHLSDSRFVREVLANAIEYDLSSEPKKQHGNRKHITEDDRRLAAKMRARERRKRDRELLQQARQKVQQQAGNELHN